MAAVAGTSSTPVVGQVVRIRGATWRVADAVTYSDCTLLEVAGICVSNSGVRRRLLLPFDRVAVDRRVRAPRVVRCAAWMPAFRALVAAASPHDALWTAASARIDLLAYQIEPALAVLGEHSSRYLLADEVGLGKTIQAGLIIAELGARSRADHVLILAPAGLRDQWASELSFRFGIECRIMDATALGRHARAWPRAVNPWAIDSVIVASLDFVKRPEVLGPVLGVSWDVLVVDEAHAVATGSERAAGVRAIAAGSHTVVLLTATPHGGDEAAFASLCAIGRLTGEGPITLFKRAREDVGQSRPRKSRLLDVRPTLAEHRMHALLDQYAGRVWREAAGRDDRAAPLAMIVLCKRALSSAASLARSVQRRLTLLEPVGGGESWKQPRLALAGAGEDESEADEEPGSALGAPGLNDSEDERRQLADIYEAALEAEASESKIRVLKRLLARVREPAIVFTEYRDTLGRLADELGDISFAMLHGGMSVAQRRIACERFNAGTARLLLSTDAGSEGLNLQTRCRLVINVELPWTPTRIEQRVGRVDRLGQQRSVHAVHLVARQTAEAAVLSRLVARVEQARRTFADFRDPIGAISEESVARSMIGGLPVQSIISRASVPSAATSPNRMDQQPAIVRVDIRREAQLEIDRLLSVRQLFAQGRAAHSATGGCVMPLTPVSGAAALERTGPWIASLAPVRRVQRRSARGARRSPGTGSGRVAMNHDLAPGVIWVYRLRLADRSGHSVEEMIVPVHSVLSRWPQMTNIPSRELRSWIENLLASGSELRGHAERAARTRVRSIGSVLVAQLDRAQRRDQAIAIALEMHAADLPEQAGLFDHRRERELERISLARQERLGAVTRRRALAEAARHVGLASEPELMLVLVVPPVGETDSGSRLSSMASVE